MLVALRALRFCYSSNMLAKESLLYKDAWQRKREHNQREETVEVQGLGMENTIRRCGLGWFLPKFNWAILRIKKDHLSYILQGNLLISREYIKRQQAVKDLQSVHVRFS